MAWKIKFSEKADKAFNKLDKPIQLRVTKKIKEIAKYDDPKLQGKALPGNLAGLWRYLVGDYRLICLIENHTLLILVLDIGHRRDVYDN